MVQIYIFIFCVYMVFVVVLLECYWYGLCWCDFTANSTAQKGENNTVLPSFSYNKRDLRFY